MVRSRKVLVVDGHPHPIASLLRMLGYDVRVTFSYGAALAVVREFRPDAILVGLGIPGLAQRLRNTLGLGKPLLVGLWDDGGETWAPGFDAVCGRSEGPVVLQRVLTSSLPPGQAR
jgi:hypothetical protein